VLHCKLARALIHRYPSSHPTLPGRGRARLTLLLPLRNALATATSLEDSQRHSHLPDHIILTSKLSTFLVGENRSTFWSCSTAALPLPSISVLVCDLTACANQSSNNEDYCPRCQNSYIIVQPFTRGRLTANVVVTCRLT